VLGRWIALSPRLAFNFNIFLKLHPIDSTRKRAAMLADSEGRSGHVSWERAKTRQQAELSFTRAQADEHDTLPLAQKLLLPSPCARV
jgi:hypothetical protein